jgi:hypothetical protein
MKNEKILGTLIASTVAAMAASGVAFANDSQTEKKETTEYCQNNTCKGHSACHGHGNECRGQNTCKGQGYLEAKNAKECKKMGGKWKKG